MHWSYKCKYNFNYTALRNTTLHYTNYIRLHYNCNYHYIALHDTTHQLQLHYFTLLYTTLHYFKLLYTTLHYFTLQYVRLHYTIPRYSTQHYSTLQYTTLITPHHNYNCNCNCTTLITLHYNYNLQLQLHYLQPLQKTQLQPPFGSSVDSLCHPWVTTANLSYRFHIFEIPPPPCAVLLVSMYTKEVHYR